MSDLLETGAVSDQQKKLRASSIVEDTWDDTESESSEQQIRKVKYIAIVIYICLQCFDAVGWAAGRASGL